MSQGQDAGRNLQALSQQLEELEQVQSQLQTQLEATRALREEIGEAMDALGDLETGETVQVPLGGDAFVKAEIADMDEVIVDIGADYAVERDCDSAVDILEEKRAQLQETIQEIEESIADVSGDIERVETQAQQFRQQLLQQQQQSQQLGSGGLGGGGR